MFKRHNVKCDDTAKLGIQFTNCEVTDLRLERARRDTFKLGRLPFHLL